MIHVLIPARANSKRLVGKNLLDVGGDPLVVRAIKMAEQIKPGEVDIHVSSDSEEILSLAEMFGARTYLRTDLIDDVSTVDEVVNAFYWDHHDQTQPLIVLQPTVVAEEKEMVEALKNLWLWGSHISEPTALGVTPHSLIWGGGRGSPPRSQSQDFGKFPLQEIGIRYYPQDLEDYTAVTAIRHVEGTFIDIDTPEDLVAARALAKRTKTILFRARMGGMVGSGHYYRTLAIAKELQHHDILFELIGWDQPNSFPFKLMNEGEMYPQPLSLIINDTLDTSEHQMLQLRGIAPVISFEDHGEGARHADAVVNALYPSNDLSNEFVGSDYAILRPEFQDSGFSRKGILVTFGGTDSLNLTARVASLLGPRAQYIKPPYSSTPLDFHTVKNRSMGAMLNNSSVVVTSAGRTVFEAAMCGTPAIVIAQNAREATHSHLGLEHGNVFLGYGPLVNNDQILRAVNAFEEDYSFQDEMSYKASLSIDGKGLQRVMNLISEVMA